MTDIAEAPWEDFPDYDGTTTPDIYKGYRARAQKIYYAKQSPLLKRTDANGKPLYTLTSGGNLSRTTQITPGTRKTVLNRDKHCQECGSTNNLELHHIIRYIDGGPNTADNLQTLCETCHRRKGGR